MICIRPDRLHRIGAVFHLHLLGRAALDLAVQYHGRQIGIGYGIIQTRAVVIPLLSTGQVYGAQCIYVRLGTV